MKCSLIVFFLSQRIAPKQNEKETALPLVKCNTRDKRKKEKVRHLEAV